MLALPRSPWDRAPPDEAAVALFLNRPDLSPVSVRDLRNAAKTTNATYATLKYPCFLAVASVAMDELSSCVELCAWNDGVTRSW